MPGDERREETEENVFDVRASEIVKRLPDLSNCSNLDKFTFDAGGRYGAAEK